jgi:hypothetical protein
VKRAIPILAAAALVIPAAAAAGSSAPLKATFSYTRGGGVLTPAQQKAYLAKRGSVVEAAARGSHCVHEWVEETLNVVGIGSRVAWVKNDTWGCYTGHYIVHGSFTVVPSLGHWPDFSSQNRYVTLGYPPGYQNVRRNSCALANIYLVSSGGAANWNMSGRIQIRGNGAIYTYPGDSKFPCFTQFENSGW